MDCVFCKIIKGEIPSKKVYEDDKVLVIHDISPRAKTHVLLFPKEHISSAMDINEQNSSVVAHIFECIPKISQELGLQNGFRIVNNCGKHGFQTVQHIHFHVMGGQQLKEDMG